jgi:NadR type nicotinamide-nucleotide adenylyltransferase
LAQDNGAIMARGFIIGGFRLPTRGHQHLIDFATRYCQGDLDIMLCTRDEDALPGALRQDWLTQYVGGRARVHRFHNSLPEDPATTPDFWTLWRDAILQILQGRAPDLLFASEPYGKRLAADLGARFMPVDPERAAISISATDVAKDISRHWDMLLPEARPHFLKRIAIIGAESCGKTTLARHLASIYSTVHVPEWARTFLEHGDPTKYPDLADIEIIAAGHAAAENSLALQANRLLILDTDHLCTAVWSRVALGEVPASVEAAIADRRYDLRLLLDDDVPLVPDILRYGGDQRQLRTQHFVAELERHQLPYRLISGGWQVRTAAAIAAVEEVMAVPPQFRALSSS